MRDRLTLHLVGGQVEIKTTKDTPDGGSLQKAADFVHAFILGADFLGIFSAACASQKSNPVASHKPSPRNFFKDSNKSH